MIDFIRIPEERLKFLRKEKKFLEELQKLSETKLTLNEEICIEAEDPLKLLRVKEVLRAIGRGFMPEDTMSLLDEEFYLSVIDIKSYAGKSRERLMTLKGRIIGSGGKTKRMIESLTGTKLSIYGKTVSIIGRWEDVERARQAIEMLLVGRMHSTVYKFLEKRR